jgi:hypothetical protein
MKSWPGLAATLALVAAGCSAPVCREQLAPALLSEQLEDSLRATSAGEEQEWRLRATLRDLPALWPAGGAIQDGRLSVSVSLAYQSDPVGGDGATEMPNVRVTFDGHAPVDGQTDQTSTFPGPTASLFTQTLFQTCNADGQERCCHFGETQCSLPVTLRLERLQGAPFPPIVVAFSAQASATVSSCPIPGPSSKLSLEVEAE